ncbi:MAG: TonB-dependent receptor, partial [Gemmatimonadetes bacterium]|nr:TonB-dependent receptor [Gemmatimonadota bacterium]
LEGFFKVKKHAFTSGPEDSFNTIGFVGDAEGLVSAGFLPEGDQIACADFGACSLSHETSLSFTGGVVYSAENGLLVTADYYRVAVADAIALTQSLRPTHGLRQGAQFQGRPVDAVAFWTNAIDTRTQGFDLVASWRLRGMAWGAADLSASLHQNSTVITANRNENFIGDTQQTLIEEAQPGRRIGVSADIRSVRGVGASFSVNHIGAVTTPFIFEETITIDGAAIADLEVTLRVADRILLGVGANNLLDKLPNRLPRDHVAQLWTMEYPSESPYGVAGRIWYMRVKMVGK